MKKGSQKTDVYDSVFDFLFSVQKEGVNKPFPKPSPSAGVYASSLIEIGTQPAIYPLEAAFNNINSYIGDATTVNLGGKVKTDLGSMLTGGGNADIKKSIGKERAKANFARIGGNLHSGIDGALVSLYSKFNGASSKTAYEAGQLFADVKRKGMKKGQDDFTFGYRTKEERENEDNVFFQRGVDLTLTTLVKFDSRLDKNFLRRLVQDTNLQDSYADRIRLVDNNLRIHGITDAGERSRLAHFLYGTGVGKDLGLYRKLPEGQRSMFDRVLYSGSTSVKESIPKKERELLEARISYRMQGETETERSREILRVLNESGRFSRTLSSSMATELAKEQIVNTGEDIANHAIATALVADIQGRSVTYEGFVSAKNRVNQIISKQSGERSLGTTVARTLLVYDWVKNSGGLGGILLDGNWEKFGNEDLNYTNIMKGVNVLDSDTGEFVGSYFAPANSVMGKLLGNAYYLHPNNLIRGLFLDGSLWLKWAHRGGQLNKRSFAYLAYRLRPGKIFTGMAKPFNFIAQGVQKILNPMMEGIKKFARNVLKRILGATGIGGWLVNILLDIIGDKLLLVVAQITQTVLLAVVAALFLLLSSGGEDPHIEAKVEGVLSSSEKGTIISVEGTTFVEEDFLYFDNEDLEGLGM